MSKSTINSIAVYRQSYEKIETKKMMNYSVKDLMLESDLQVFIECRYEISSFSEAENDFSFRIISLSLNFSTISIHFSVLWI